MKKTNNNKGFTLVELIVVLVILAILAAILVPALLGYIDRAREKQYVLNAKSALTATQAEFSSLYGEGKSITAASIAARATTISSTADTPEDTHFYVKLETTAAKQAAIADNHASFTVKEAYYTEKGFYCVFDGTSWQTFSKEADFTAAGFTAGDYTQIY